MSLVRQTLVLEFKELAAKAQEFKKLIDTAKTYPKREMFKKKLKDNNIKAAEILAALDKLAREEAQKAAGVKNEASGNEGRTETPIGISSDI